VQEVDHRVALARARVVARRQEHVDVAVGRIALEVALERRAVDLDLVGARCGGSRGERGERRDAGE
jgi:hypothetical protein